MKISIQLENDFYHYSVKLLYTLFLRLERVWWPFLSVALPSTLSYGEGRMWQVTAYRHLTYISPRCVISCLTHIYSVPITHNTTHPHLIYILYLVTTTGRFCELRSGMVQPLTEVSMAYPKNESTLPETFRGEWVPIGFENQLSPLSEFGRGARDTCMKKKYKSRKINGTESRRTWITKDWRGGWIMRRPPNTLS